MTCWIPLHNRSEYSVLGATASVVSIAARAAQWQLPAVGLTDLGNLYGAVEFYKACHEEKVRPILGCELVVAPQSRFDKKRIPGMSFGYSIVLLAINNVGYRNLCKLSSAAHLEGFYYTPRIDKKLLLQHAEGLICLSGAMHGRVSALILEHNEEGLAEEIGWYQEVFGTNYFLEIARHRMSEEAMEAEGIVQEHWLYQKVLDFQREEETINQRLIEISQETHIPLVATNLMRYLDRENWKAQEICMNIGCGETCETWELDSLGQPKQKTANPKRMVELSHEYYFKTPEEMRHLFSDVPAALAATIEIADRCHVEFDFKTKYYPVFVPPALEGKVCSKEERYEAAEKFLRTLCAENVHRRYSPPVLLHVAEQYPGKDPMAVIEDRLTYELGLITSKGMTDYLLIVFDFIHWAKQKGIPVGPGRGSGTGSIVLYLIGVTDIEPLRFNLFFERFINPERLSYPDIDVDICMARRAEVIEYTLQKYGKDKVAQIITFGTMKAKMAIRDVGRVLGVSLGKVNAIAKLIPEELHITLDKALEVDPELRSIVENDEEIGRVFLFARQLEGVVRNTGIHAAGLIISADPLTEHVPLCQPKDAAIAVTQYSMKPVEAVGMLKIDFLGLKTLTSIQKAVDAVKAGTGRAIDWVNLPLDDQATFALLNQGKTQGIFQLESSGMQDLARQLHIDRFEEIIAVGALYRPGPMEMIPSFIQRKHGREPIDIDHPHMGDILNETYGIMIYQEQVMQIASRLAGYSLGEGDVLRKAMGKKDRDEMSRQREKFRKGAIANHIDEETAIRIFDKIEKFASYGFNKSHAAAYGYLSYVTAYLKANYPGEWMAALMTCDRDDISKVAKLIRECQAMKLSILPPDCNDSGTEFTATSQGIRFALSGIKGVGEAVVAAIIEERRERGRFSSLADFLHRIDTRKIHKKIMELLIEAGAFDFTGSARPQLLLMLEPMYQAAARAQQEKERGILCLFPEWDNVWAAECVQEAATAPPPPLLEQLKKEKELMGVYLSGHPLEQYRALLPQLSCLDFEHVADLEGDAVFRAACIIETVQVRLAAKTQRKFAILTASDPTERYEVLVWSQAYESYHALLREGQLIYAVLQADTREGTIRLQARWLADLDTVDAHVLQSCNLAYDRAKMQARSASNGAQQKYEIKKPSIAMSSPAQKLSVDIDITSVRLSHILALKKAFRNFPGSMPIDLRFHNGGACIGTVAIQGEWGTTDSRELRESLQAIAPIFDVKLG